MFDSSQTPRSTAHDAQTMSPLMNPVYYHPTRKTHPVPSNPYMADSSCADMDDSIRTPRRDASTPRGRRSSCVHAPRKTSVRSRSLRKQTRGFRSGTSSALLRLQMTRTNDSGSELGSEVDSPHSPHSPHRPAVVPHEYHKYRYSPPTFVWKGDGILADPDFLGNANTHTHPTHTETLDHAHPAGVHSSHVHKPQAVKPPYPPPIGITRANIGKRFWDEDDTKAPRTQALALGGGGVAPPPVPAAPFRSIVPEAKCVRSL
jgi:hypothetical protein